MMPIYLLGSRTPHVRIPNEALSISISGSVNRAELYIEAAQGQKIVQVNPRMVIVPAVTEGLTVGVRARGAGTFGHDTIVHLAIASDVPSEVDPLQVSFDPVNVSGSRAMELAALAPEGDHVDVAVRSVPDAPLSPLASMARTAARRVGWSPQRHAGGSLSIGVDTSASMRWAFDAGSVSAAVDMIVGVADVAGIRDVTAALVGVRCTPVDAPVGELARAISSASIRWSAGVRWSQLPDTPRTIVITDSVNPLCDGRLSAVCVPPDGAAPSSGPALRAPPRGTTAQRYLAENSALVDELATTLLPVLT